MNIHYLELFYFVAKYGGIAAAVRNIPYGIQQPAMSGQIAKLEESLGSKLFQRRPFALSPAGAELFEFIKPFFDNIETVAEKLRKNASPQLRIAAPSIVLHDRPCPRGGMQPAGGVEGALGLRDLELPTPLVALSEEVSRDECRADVSSTKLRQSDSTSS